MLLRPKTALLVVIGALAACSGGGSGSATLGFSCASTDPRVICLESCNLGCSATGCANSDIAQNQIVILQFSEPIDENSVGPSSIRFRTPSGEQPVGEFFVVGKQVEFVPTLSISGGTTFFGFTAGETYTMTIPGGDTQPSVVRSTSGKPFERTLTCTLQVTRGIVDLNGVAPRATLIVPTQAQLDAAPLDTEIVLEFNEMIDATPFLSGTQSPVTFGVRRNREAAGGGWECDPASEQQVLGGTQALDFDAGRGISILTFTPAQQLPGNVCVEINVTDGVTDLSGRPAQPQAFTFRTLVTPLVEDSIVEDFDDAVFLDVDSSAAQWDGGFATFARIGGDGRHGPFSTALAVDTQTTVEGKRLFTMDTDNTVIPASNTSTGSAIAVTDGRFYFTNFIVPGDVRLQFLGSKPAMITATGRIEVVGHVDVAGAGNAFMPGNTQVLGQPGGLGGAGGGNGGNGGNRISQGQATTLPPVGGANASNQGQAGQDARLLAGHGYFSTATNSGGRGSTVFPASGLNSAVYYGGPTPSIHYSPSASAGGGGGGFVVPGGTGRVVSNNHAPFPGLLSQMGPQAPGGSAVQLFPFPPPSGIQRASEHFLVGGSGGGGTASHAALSLNLLPDKWTPGAGGGGGGGGIALRAGNSLRLAPGSKVLAFGGSAANSPPGGTSTAQVAPAGGGSGGSVVLQSGRLTDIGGLIDVRGGTGGTFNRSASAPPSGTNPPQGVVLGIEGGDGSDGFVRFEAPTAPPLSALATMQPPPVAANVAALTERDDLDACT